MSATIADVARRAGVGVGTVSRVLNNQPKVGPATRAKVLEAIAELDYVPSATARSLSSGRTRTVAVVSVHLVIPSVIERIRGIEQSLTAAAHDLIIRNAETVARRDQVLREMGRTDRIDGAVFISVAPRDDEYARIRRSGLPVVLVDSRHRQLPWIVCDDVEGGRTAGRHLLDLGHLRIGFVGDPPDPSLGVRSSRMRLQGLTEAMAERGLAIDPRHVAEGEHSRAGGHRSALGILSAPDRPSAILAANDTLAFGVLQAARDLRLDVPGDLSVVGYDDIDAADLVGLTTVRQPLEETGTRAVRHLLSLIERSAGQDRPPLREVLPVSLVARGTSGPAPTA